MSRRQGITAVVALFVLASCAPAASSGSTRPPSPTASSSASPPNTASPALDRLTIAAMRARAYPASSFTLVRTDGDQGGYVNTVVSYQSDSLRVYALVATPDGARPAAGWPVIVLNHGYIDPSTYPRLPSSFRRPQPQDPNGYAHEEARRRLFRERSGAGGDALRFGRATRQLLSCRAGRSGSNRQIAKAPKPLFARTRLYIDRQLGSVSVELAEHEYLSLVRTFACEPSGDLYARRG